MASNDTLDDAVRKVVTAVERQRAQTLHEAIASGWRYRDEVIAAAHALCDAYSAASEGGQT